MFTRLSSKRKKKAQGSGGSQPAHEEFPQVWLAVSGQPPLEELGSQANLIETPINKPESIPATATKKVVIREKKQTTDKELDNEADVLEPQEVEAVGWDHEEELDYSKLGQQQQHTDTALPILSVVGQQNATLTNTETDRQRRPSGISSLGGSIFSYAQSTPYQVHHLGDITSVSSHWIQEESPQTILKVVEMAQRHGEIPWRADVSDGNERRMLIVSKYGVKITDERKQRVFGRFALHTIVNVIQYTSIYGTSNVVLRVIKDTAKNHQECDLYLFECQDSDQASDICVTLGQAFDAVINKMKMDENLHGPLIIQ